MSSNRNVLFSSLAAAFILACGGSGSMNGAHETAMMTAALNPDTAEVVAVDRFSDSAAHFFKRSANPALPSANAPIDFDEDPFITHGLGPGGEHIAYYNFDEMPTQPAPIYVLFTPGATSPVAGQLNIIDALPGDPGYSDFWNVTKVTVPADYVANTITSVGDIMAKGLMVEKTTTLVNCPVVPDGSTATLRYTAQETPALVRGWYRGQVVKYFTFGAHALMTAADGSVPLSDIYVTFNKNPDPNDPSSGPPSGFVMEPGSEQVHNVTETLPEDAAYSPLWDVNVYDNRAFGSVMDLPSAIRAPILARGVAQFNCPIVSKGN